MILSTFRIKYLLIFVWEYVTTGGDNGKGKGTIYVTGIFDREKESVIKLPMCMCDSGKPRQCGIRYLNVRVLDKNDNKHAAGYQHILVYNYKGNIY